MLENTSVVPAAAGSAAAYDTSAIRSKFGPARPPADAGGASTTHLPAPTVLALAASPAACELTGFSPRIDRIFSSATSKRYLKG